MLFGVINVSVATYVLEVNVFNEWSEIRTLKYNTSLYTIEKLN